MRDIRLGIIQAMTLYRVTTVTRGVEMVRYQAALCPEQVADSYYDTKVIKVESVRSIAVNLNALKG